MPELKLQNLGNLVDVINRLPKKVANKQVRQATVEGARLIRDYIKRTAPVRPSTTTAYRKGNKRPPPGRLRRLVKAKARRGKRTYQKASVFYPTQGAGNDPKNAFYWRFVEDGTKRQAPQPFIAVAVSVNFRRVVNHTIKRINQGVRNEMAKARRSAGT